MKMRREDGSFYIGERNGHTLDTYHVSQGDSNDCGPHVVTMAVNFWRGEAVLEAGAVARAMNYPRLRIGFPPVVVRRIPNWATFPWGIADMLRVHGIPARWRLRASEDDLHRALDEDRIAMPIFGEPLRRHGWRWAGWSHVAILYGWDPEAQIYWFVDSTMPYAPTEQERETFLHRWQDMGRLLVETL
jgi:hypothetical protein